MEIAIVTPIRLSFPYLLSLQYNFVILSTKGGRFISIPPDTKFDYMTSFGQQHEAKGPVCQSGAWAQET